MEKRRAVLPIAISRSVEYNVLKSISAPNPEVSSMRSPLSRFMFALALAAAALPALAQQQQPAAMSKTLKLGDMPKLGKQHLFVKAPELSMRSEIRSTRAKPREWAFMAFDYETSPKWIDDLAVTYYVLTLGYTDEGEKEYNLFTATVHYGDVAKGKHKAAAVLPPQAIERYGAPIAFAVEVSDDGNDPLSKSVEGTGVPADWRTNEKFTEKYVNRDGYLVDRSRTPFQFVNPDDYEAVR